GQRLIVNDCPHLARGERIVRLCKRGRIEKRRDERPRFRGGGFHAHLPPFLIGAVDEDFGHGHTRYAGGVGKPDCLRNAVWRNGGAYFMHDGSSPAEQWMV